MTETRFDVVPAHLAVKAMRDNGYRNAAYAIAELMDNSIQAGAKHVELLCAEVATVVRQRQRRRIHEVAVLDDGSGMSANVLRQALQFGNGTRLNDRTGIGRFGMGLPSASISQCRRVDVWSWQNGVDSAVYTYLDIAKVERQEQVDIPKPARKEIPELWRAAGKNFGKSGTLVVWSNIDRMMWRTAKAILDNSEFVVGRMYRRFIHENEISIRLAQFLADSPMVIEERKAVANDPSYIMAPSSTPPPYNTRPMFEPYGDRWEIPFKVAFGGVEHEVIVRFTHAKSEARSGENPGARLHGQHAARNIGVSIVRARRELELEQSWVIQYDPTERWWGVEVEFPPALDELFGVTNNKQSARNFAELAQVDVDELLRDGRTIEDVREEMIENEDPAGPLLEMAQTIERTLKNLRAALKSQTRGTRQRRRRHESSDSPEERGTRVTRRRQEEGHEGVSDPDESSLSDDERREQIEEELKDAGIAADDAKELAAYTVSKGIKYTFVEAPLEGRLFFTVKPKAGEIFIKINTNHPAYSHLVEVLERDEESQSADDLRGRLEMAAQGLKLLLMAWARFEDEQVIERKREELQDIRTDWGRYAAYFLERED